MSTRVPRETVCEYSNCQTMVASGEGVTVSHGGYRKKFCHPLHAAWSLEEYSDKALRTTLAELKRLAAADRQKAAEYAHLTDL